MKRYVWCNLIVMLTATAAPAASYFVAVDGQAGNDGSQAKPWPSFAATWPAGPPVLPNFLPP